jgi:hypothetical protein
MKQISLEDLTMEEISLMSAEELTDLLQNIAGRQMEIGQRAKELEPEYRQLRAESAYLKEVRASIQSTLRMIRAALGD